MRLLIGFFLVHIICVPIISLMPVEDWADELGLDEFPKGPPGHQEREQLLAEARVGRPRPLVERAMQTVDSIWDYHKPWPAAKARATLARRAAKRRATPRWWEERAPWVGDCLDAGQFVVAWAGTRMMFQERLIGFDQDWRMFAPNVHKSGRVARAILVYQDGSRKVVHSLADPEDLTCYRGMRFCAEKELEFVTKLEKNDDCRRGYCNLLAHRHPTNGGSPLVKVLLVMIAYDYPAPGEDAREALARLTGPPGWEEAPAFYEYDVRGRQGRRLDQ